MIYYKSLGVVQLPCYFKGLYFAKLLARITRWQKHLAIYCLKCKQLQLKSNQYWIFWLNLMFNALTKLCGLTCLQKLQAIISWHEPCFENIKTSSHKFDNSLNKIKQELSFQSITVRCNLILFKCTLLTANLWGLVQVTWHQTLDLGFLIYHFQYPQASINSQNIYSQTKLSEVQNLSILSNSVGFWFTCWRL